MSQAQAIPVIESLRQLFGSLANDQLTVQDVAQRVGSIEQDYGGDLQIVVRPRDGSFSKIDVLRQPHTQKLASLVAYLSPGAVLKVTALRQAFGDYNEAPLGDHDPLPEIIFYLDHEILSLKFALVAQVRPGPNGIRDGIVSQLSILREDR